MIRKTAHSEAALFRPVHRRSSPGALQAKLLVQSWKLDTNTSLYPPPHRSYKLHPAGSSTAASMWIKI